jgi:hypothetical protein
MFLQKGITKPQFGLALGHLVNEQEPCSPQGQGAGRRTFIVQIVEMQIDNIVGPIGLRHIIWFTAKSWATTTIPTMPGPANERASITGTGRPQTPVPLPLVKTPILVLRALWSHFFSKGGPYPSSAPP